MQRPCLLCFTLCDSVSAVAVDGEIGVVAVAAVAVAAMASAVAAASAAVVGLPHAMGLRTQLVPAQPLPVNYQILLHLLLSVP